MVVIWSYWFEKKNHLLSISMATSVRRVDSRMSTDEHLDDIKLQLQIFTFNAHKYNYKLMTGKSFRHIEKWTKNSKFIQVKSSWKNKTLKIFLKQGHLRTRILLKKDNSKINLFLRKLYQSRNQKLHSLVVVMSEDVKRGGVTNFYIFLIWIRFKFFEKTILSTQTRHENQEIKDEFGKSRIFKELRKRGTPVILALIKLICSELLPIKPI